jgi:hypothetical protein
VVRAAIDRFTPDPSIHVVVADDEARAACTVITAYIPEEDQWSPDYRKRRIE